VLTVGSLFAGIGGFDLGLERAGMRTVWFCEQDEFCRRVLARHWPGVPCYPDVRQLSGISGPAECCAVCGHEWDVHDREGFCAFCETRCPGEPDVRALVADAGRGRVQPHGDLGELASAEPRDREAVRAGELPAAAGGGSEGRGMVPVRVPPVDVLCGGFPCQDLSYAGRGAGLAGERSGLWRHFARIIGELRPRYVIVENVPALTVRGLDTVLADLAACGFDAEWDHLPASAFGAPHRRDRIWLVAYPHDAGRGERRWAGPDATQQPALERRGEVCPYCAPDEQCGLCAGHERRAAMAHADGQAGNGTRAPGEALPRPGEVERPGRRGSGIGNPWESEPDVGRVAHGVPDRVHRLRALGNALVPQIAEWIGRQIIAWEAQA